MDLNQALRQRTEAILDHIGYRLFTHRVNDQGSGRLAGKTQFGTYTWPAINLAILTVIDDGEVEQLMNTLRKLNEQAEMQGLRAFVWNVESQI